MNQVYDVADIIGSASALTQEQGQILFERIVDSIKKEDIVILDFSGIESMISAFLNIAIGKLYGVFTENTLSKHLIFKNFPEAKNSTLNLVVRNAMAFYNNTQGYNDVVKEVIG